MILIGLFRVDASHPAGCNLLPTVTVRRELFVASNVTFRRVQVHLIPLSLVTVCTLKIHQNNLFGRSSPTQESASEANIVNENQSDAIGFEETNST